MHFLLWTKRSHENTNFDIFKCPNENLLNSSCHFPNHKWVFLQIFHDSYVMKYAALYFFRSNVVQKGPIKVQTPLSQQLPSKSWDPVKLPTPQFFENLVGGSTLLQKGGDPFVSWDLNPPHDFSWSCIYLQNTNLLKFHLSSRKS